ncbi:uncharacterized protein LOC111377965 [Olea europaea var. sylvestris]|uniref:uncharacterized protein LOC111377965 n=1 Tax=Olea europaea var. sylvestris TaxID=158386 RepID=UPI000C1D3BA4|nr:uncharacterized protein LOC111377965 [Olea europaea var. sylvestris]
MQIVSELPLHGQISDMNVYNWFKSRRARLRRLDISTQARDSKLVIQPRVQKDKLRKRHIEVSTSSTHMPGRRMRCYPKFTADSIDHVELQKDLQVDENIGVEKQFEDDNMQSQCDRLSESTLKKLIDILKINPYCRFFRSLSEVSDFDSCCIVLGSDPGLNQRVYNMPSCEQVAAVWVDDDPSANIKTRDILIYGHSNTAHRVNYYYGCYDPLQYPLIFTYGEAGWHECIEKVNLNTSIVHEDFIQINQIDSAEQFIEIEDRAMKRRKKRITVSCREYYCYKLQIRLSDKSVLLHTGRLLQQYIVDMYVKIEIARLDYFRNNQKIIRGELHLGILDSIQNSENRGYKIGKSIVLPIGFIGGPRNLTKRYMDAMCLVQRYGKPDVFLTITCNPNWSEIKQELRHNDSVQNRPDLLSRIFRAKLEELKIDLIKREILGPIAAYVYAIEFQKRGLPHVHFLLIFKMNFKVTNSTQIDEIVSCEILDPKRNPHLHATVVKHMMHGPCEQLNPTNVCMKNNRTCKNKYPREYILHTSLGNDSYPLYRRRDDGLTVKVRGSVLDNRWIVPYNPYILAKYDCHTNVEICSSVKVVKYLYKYVYKGHDRVNFTVNKETNEHYIDEISNYQTARWIFAPEAIWRIFSFDLFDISPSIVSLQLHIEDAQLVTYNETDDLSEVINKDSIQRTIIVAANPSEGERYFLRVLLNHVKGPKSFQDLRTVNNIVVPTYHEAAFLHGLIGGNNYCEMCLNEAITYDMPISLRRLFANVLIFCSPANPRNLWVKFKVYMIEDFLHASMTVCDAEIRVLRCINSFLEVFGTNINNFGLVDFDVIVNNADALANMILKETTNINIQSDIFFINGPGGTRKTFLYKALLAAVRSRQLIALATASSGVAASLLPAGRTGDSLFKISLQARSDMRCSVSKQSSFGQLLQMTKLIVWDEALMINRCAFETLDKMLKDITECELPFDGKVVVFGGDFRQVLPVVQR